MRAPLNIFRLFIESLLVVALAEIMVHVTLPVIAPGVEGIAEEFLDGALLTLFAGVMMIWRFRAAVARAGRDVDLSQHASKRTGHVVGLGVCAVGIALTLGAQRWVREELTDKAHARFEHTAERISVEVERLVVEPIEGLLAIKGVYNASRSVERGDFRAFIASRDMTSEETGVQSMGFMRRIKRSEAATFEASARANGAPDFAIHTLPLSNAAPETKPDMFVVEYCYPGEHNEVFWGVDLGADPTRREVIERAMWSGTASLSWKLDAYVPDAKATELLYCIPVYRNGTNPRTPQEREDSIVGLAFATVVLEEALAGTDEVAAGQVDFRIFDGTVPNEANLIYDSDTSIGSKDHEPDAVSVFRQEQRISVGGRTWTIVTADTPEFWNEADRWIPAAILIGGCFLSVLAAGLTLNMLTGKARAYAMACSMTNDLAVAKAEADRLANIVRLTSNAVIVSDRNGMIEWTNDSFTRITGYSLDEVRGRRYGEFLQGPDTDRDASNRLAEAIRDGKAESVEIVYYGKTGRRYVVVIEMVPLKDAAGVLTGIMSIESDITERVEQQQRLHEQTEALGKAKHVAESANRAKSEFLANMSHEIRTPLTAILGFAEILRSDGDIAAAPKSRVQAIDTVRTAGTHLMSVLNDILDLSKIEANRMSVESTETPLVSLFFDVESIMHSRAKGKGLSLTMKLGSPVPSVIMSDPTRLRQILMNLIGNAVKFCEEGGVTVDVRQMSVEGRSRLVVDIEDTGVGMSSEQTSMLFEAFGQADTTVTRKFGGTGLGLTISRRLARLMGGDVSLLRTAIGKGSCFRVELPLVPAAGAVAIDRLEAVQSSAPVIAPAKPALAGRVLLAEDGPDNQRLISHHLRKAGAEVSIADNGKIAYDMILQAQAEGRPFVLLVTDMQMPEMDGYTLAKTLRNDGSKLPIIALTAHAMAEDRGKCLSAGCDDYATKPINASVLLTKCAEWIRAGSSASKEAA